MDNYLVIARKYRPQTFKEVIGQSAVVTVLQNALKFNKIAHAYLFCGTRGTGKTTLARIFAKALNCTKEECSLRPCNECPSCKEITLGNAMDVIEIDGASHRGIDDIRAITETIGFTPIIGKYKIYIIDEVHMLTKEAFNALLKNLEEPPSHVKFFFATTEPHKLPSTILSRCQRFWLRRISTDDIIAKLKMIAQDCKMEVEEEVFTLVSTLAEGSLRDAESLFDQILTFHKEKITIDAVTELLGLAPPSLFQKLDKAVQESSLSTAFEISAYLFSQGKDLHHFVDTLINHYRRLLMLKIEGRNASKALIDSALIYTKEELISLLEYLLAKRQELKSALSTEIIIESMLLHILQTKKRLAIEPLVERLLDLEKNLPSFDAAPPPPAPLPPPLPAPILPSPPATPAVLPEIISLKSKEYSQQRELGLLQFAAIELEATIKR